PNNKIRVIPVPWLLEPSQWQIVRVVPYHTAEPRPVRVLLAKYLNVRTLAPQLAVLANPGEHVIPVRSSLKIRRRRLRKHNRSPHLLQSSRLGRVRLAIGCVLSTLFRDIYIAAVQLEIVHAPRRKQLRILKKMILASAFRFPAARKPAA